MLLFNTKHSKMSSADGRPLYQSLEHKIHSNCIVLRSSGHNDGAALPVKYFNAFCRHSGGPMIILLKNDYIWSQSTTPVETPCLIRCHSSTKNPGDTQATRTTGQKTREEIEIKGKKCISNKNKLRNLNLTLLLPKPRWLDSSFRAQSTTARVISQHQSPATLLQKGLIFHHSWNTWKRP